VLRKSDLLWLLGYPVYQLVGTLRHEGGHALAAMLEGAAIREFVWWPTVREGKGFYWGYVCWYGHTSWWTIAAPYLVDLLTYAVFFWLCTRVTFKRRWLWVNAMIVGLVSPLVNSLYNYWGGFRSMNDVGRLLQALPPWQVHAYFASTLVLYGLGLWVVLGRSRRLRRAETQT
jgi:hypothetical protein